MNLVTKMKKDWDRRAGHHARYWIATESYETDESFSRSGEQSAAAILELLAPRREEGGRALEIGCGIGRILQPMAAHFDSVCGVDVSGEMIAQSKKWLRDVANVETHENSGVDLEQFSSSEFDVVYSYIAFQHMPRPVFQNYLHQVHRVLRGSGLLVFQMYLGASCEPPLGDTLSLRVYQESELQKLLEVCGFVLDGKRLEHRAPRDIESWILIARRQREPANQNETPWLSTDCESARSPMDDFLYRNLADRYLRKGDREKALEALTELIRFNPANLEAWIDRTALLVEAARFVDAMKTLEKLIEVHPTYPQAYSSLIQLQVLHGRAQEATETLSQLEHNCAHGAEDAIAEAGRHLQHSRAAGE